MDWTGAGCLRTLRGHRRSSCRTQREFGRFSRVQLWLMAHLVGELTWRPVGSKFLFSAHGDISMQGGDRSKKDLSQQNQYEQSCGRGFEKIKEHNRVLLFSELLQNPGGSYSIEPFSVGSDSRWRDAKNTPPPPPLRNVWVEGQV